MRRIDLVSKKGSGCDYAHRHVIGVMSDGILHKICCAFSSCIAADIDNEK